MIPLTGNILNNFTTISGITAVPIIWNF
jgi:hypothetical protein